MTDEISNGVRGDGIVLDKTALVEAFESAQTDRCRLIFHYNKHALAQAMHVRGLTCVTVEYSGEGDSGQQDSTSFDPADPDPAWQVELAQEQWGWEDNTHKLGLEFAAMCLEDAASMLCDDAVSVCGHEGWENGSGGGGTFTLSLSPDPNGGPTVVMAGLEHFDCYVERSTSEHVL